jgi:hypothetical protein
LSKIKLTYSKGGPTGEKKTVEVSATECGSYDYILTTRGCWLTVICDEAINVGKGEIKTIKIKPLKLKSEEIVLPCPLTRNALGCLLSLGSGGAPKKVEQDRELTYAIFAAYKKGTIEKNEVIGVVNLFNTVVSFSALAKWLLDVRHFVTHFARRPIRKR